VSPSQPVVLIEPGARYFGGHWQTNLVAVAAAARRSGRAVSVICPGELPGSVHAGLSDAGVAIVRAGTGWATAKRATVGRSAALTRLSAAAGRTIGLNPFELAALRAVESRYAPGEALVVILTANSGATGATCLLSPVPHLRVVHTVEGGRLPLLSVPGFALRRRTVVVCPTEPVAAAFSALYPGLRVEVAAFSAVEPGDYLSEAERAEARGMIGIGSDACAVAMLGGWWPWKDNHTVLAALSRLRRPVVLLCGGTPIDADALRALARHDHVDVRLLGARLTDVEVRSLYAASSLTVVSRRRGVGTESGLVMDAARYGVPLICSDHDPDLLRRLAGSNWARTFAAGDPADLAAVLGDAAVRPPARPDRGAARAMGLRDGAGLLSLYDALAERMQA
jgi:hypothetical protein